jgi:diguanylate cyclase (GGDEF)-like protein
MGDALSVADILRQLDHAIDDHVAWLKAWHRAIVLGSADGNPESIEGLRDLGRFGAWYVHNQHNVLVNQPALRHLARLHRDMHELAHDLARSTRAGRSVAEADYDRIMAMAQDFVAQARKLEKAFARASSDLDPLTGLHNRLSMNRNLERERSRALRLSRPCSVALADLDHFKSINDRYGHTTGDWVLAAAAECFLASVRPYDLIYRYGGEEFLLCLPDASVDTARKILLRILERLRTRRINVDAVTVITVTCSFGVTAVCEEASVEETISRADQALYQAKRQGRSQVCVWQRQDGRSAAD